MSKQNANEKNLVVAILCGLSSRKTKKKERELVRTERRRIKEIISINDNGDSEGDDDDKRAPHLMTTTMAKE